MSSRKEARRKMNNVNAAYDPNLIVIRPSHDIYFSKKQRREVVFEDVLFRVCFIQGISPEFNIQTLNTKVILKNVRIE